MLFDDLLNNPAKWMVESRDEHDIVLTSRIRLARNLTATPFPGWATRQQREETLKLTSGEARQIPVMKGGYYAELSGLTQQQKQLLVERHEARTPESSSMRRTTCAFSTSCPASSLKKHGEPSPK